MKITLRPARLDTVDGIPVDEWCLAHSIALHYDENEDSKLFYPTSRSVDDMAIKAARSRPWYPVFRSHSRRHSDRFYAFIWADDAHTTYAYMKTLDDIRAANGLDQPR